MVALLLLLENTDHCDLSDFVPLFFCSSHIWLEFDIRDIRDLFAEHAGEMLFCQGALEGDRCASLYGDTTVS